MKKKTFQEMLLEKIKPEDVLDLQAQVLKQKSMEIIKVDIGLSDERCYEIAEEQGGKVIVITKMKYNHQKWIYTSQINVKNVNDSMDMYHKLAGNYAPDKVISLNLDGKSTPEIDEELRKLEQIKSRYDSAIDIEPAPEAKHLTKPTRIVKVERNASNNKLTLKPKTNRTTEQPDGKKGYSEPVVEKQNDISQQSVDTDVELW